MAIPYSAVAAAAALAAGAALKGEEGRALNNGPDYIRDGNPTGVVDKIGQAIARNTCRRYSDNPDAVSGERALDFERVCRPYLDNIGYGSGPEVDLPFRGGQCVAGYTVTIETITLNLDGTDNTVRTDVETNILGPVRGVEIQNRNPNNPQAETVVLLHGTGSGTVVTQGSSCPNGCFRDPKIISVVRTSGLPDDCGNPDVDVRQPIPPEDPEEGPEDFNPGPDIDIQIDVNITPDALVEVNIGTGPIIINPFGGGGGDGDGDPGTDPDTSPPAPEPGQENPGGNGGFGGDDNFGEPPAGRRWVGCCIRITQTPENVSVIATSEPEDVYPSVIGNVRLVCDAAGNRFRDTPVRILAKHVCVWEPVQKLNPVGVRVDLLPGYGYTFTPYSVPSGD